MRRHVPREQGFIKRFGIAGNPHHFPVDFISGPRVPPGVISRRRRPHSQRPGRQPAQAMQSPSREALPKITLVARLTRVPRHFAKGDGPTGTGYFQNIDFILLNHILDIQQPFDLRRRPPR